MSYKTRITGWLACSITGWSIDNNFFCVRVVCFRRGSVCLIVFFGSDSEHLGAVVFCQLHLVTVRTCQRSTYNYSIVYFLTIILTIVIALATSMRGLVFLFLILQICRFYSYAISFIPFGQKILKRACECCWSSITEWSVCVVIVKYVFRSGFNQNGWLCI